MSRGNSRGRTWTLATACVVVGAACDGAPRPQDDGAGAGGAGRQTAEAFGQDDYDVFARSDSARGEGGDGGEPGDGLQDQGAGLAAAGGRGLVAAEAGSAEGAPGGEERPAAQEPGPVDGAVAGPQDAAATDGAPAGLQDAGAGEAALASGQEPGASGQTSAGSPDAAGQGALPAPAMVVAGTRVQVVLDEEVSADRHLPGHAVIATVVADVTGPEGELLIGEGAKLLGRVTASEPSPGPGEDAHLEIAFETLSANGFERPLQAALAGGARPSNPFGGFVEPRPYQGRIRAGTPLHLEIRAAFAVPRQAADTAAPPGDGSGHAR